MTLSPNNNLPVVLEKHREEFGKFYLIDHKGVLAQGTVDIEPPGIRGRYTLLLTDRSNAVLYSIGFLLVLTDAAAQMYSFSLHARAWGDDASRGNMGVSVEIQTHVYRADYGAFDYFWVGSNLENGAFIQFGYGFEPGYYCLKGRWTAGKFTCLGESDTIARSDARWEWQYWPDPYGKDFYYEKGPANSAGINGTWHTYSIVPNTLGSWSRAHDPCQTPK